MKKFISKITAFISVVCFILTGLGNWFSIGLQTSATKIITEDASADFIPVYTIEDLYNVRNDLDASYRLMNDIDLTEATAEGGAWDYMGNGWNPIGSNDVYGDEIFTGVFDGGGHTIKGMRIEIINWPSGSKDTAYLGLFAHVSGEIRDLHMESAYISSFGQKSIYAGGIAGCSSGIITECSTSGDIFSTIPFSSGKSFFYAGGIAGANIGGSITACYNVGDISFILSSGSRKSFFFCAGGIAGSNGGNIINSYNIGSISASPSYYGESHAGGITGDNTVGSIVKCYNIGGISANYAGGIAGYYGGSVSACYNMGVISAISYGSSCGGGIVGYIIRGNITNCYNSGTVSVSSYDTYVGGIAGYHYDGFGSDSCNITNCYNIGKTIVNDYSGNNYNGYGIAYLKGSSEIINSYYLDGTGTSSVGAVSLTEEQMLLSSMFVGFDFDNVWMQNIYADYPYPQLRNLPQNLKEPAKSVRIIFLPDKLTYFEGEALDLSGGVIEVFYASGSTSQVPMTVDMISGFDNTKVGKQTLTVTYEGVTDTFEVMINAVEVSFIELISLPTKTVYLKGEEPFDPTGGKVKITYNNGENKVVELTANMVSGFDNTNVGKHLLTVTYENFTDTFEIEIIAYLVGDINEDSFVNESDVEYLLYHIFYPQQYPARQDCDFDGDGGVGDKDAECLLYHVFFPDDYPLKNIDKNYNKK